MDTQHELRGVADGDDVHAVARLDCLNALDRLDGLDVRLVEPQR